MFRNALALLFSRFSLRILWAAISWPRFSVTSYAMVSDLYKQKLRPKTIIDVGANTGQFSVSASKFFPHAKIHSFEPVADCYEALRGNVRKLSNISTYQIALGRRIEEADMYINDFRHSSSLLPLTPAHKQAFPDAVEVGTVKVSVTTLDNFFKEIDLVGPVLLKLDVQGSEADVLKGGTEVLRRIDYVLMETSFRPMYEGEIVFSSLLDQMEAIGFKFLRPVGWLVDPKSNEILQMDALFSKGTD